MVRCVIIGGIAARIVLAPYTSLDASKYKPHKVVKVSRLGVEKGRSALTYQSPWRRREVRLTMAFWIGDLVRRILHPE